MNYHQICTEKRNMSKPMSEQIQKLADRYEKATGKKFDVKTNAQKIRGMSDEELAEFLIDLADYGNLKIRDWLQQPAEEDDYER